MPRIFAPPPEKKKLKPCDAFGSPTSGNHCFCSRAGCCFCGKSMAELTIDHDYSEFADDGRFENEAPTNDGPPSSFKYT